MNKSKSQLPKYDPLDKRLNAIRADISDARLEQKVKADRFVKGNEARIIAPICDLKLERDFASETQHQLLRGEEILVFDVGDGWAWVQSKCDGYVGYILDGTFSSHDNAMLLTHVVQVAMTFCYPGPELRNPPLCSLSMGARVVVTGSETVRGTEYSLLSDGSAIIAKHLRGVGEHNSDFVAVSELFLHTPYLWGGASGAGIDCSSLVQLSMRMCGREVLRDADLQGATIGEEIDSGDNFANLQRGDLIFWRGHVAIHKGSIHKVPQLIHSSGHTMSVAIEPLQEALERITYLYEKPIGFRRP